MRLCCALLLVCTLTSVVAEAGVKLKAIQFPSQTGALGGSKKPPDAAPLGQSIVFVFDGKPKIGAGIAVGLRITIDAGNNLGQAVGRPAFGTYEVSGNKVIFNPRIPSAPLPSGFGPQSDNATDAALPGYLPATTYRIDVIVGAANSVKNLSKVGGKLNLPVRFTTMPVVPGPSALIAYFNNAGEDPPKLKAKKITPKPAIDGLYPNAFDDAAGLFSQIPADHRPPFKLTFKGPLLPTLDNVSSTRIRLRAIADASGVPEDLPVSADVILTSNELSKSRVLVYPRGILPLGHTLAVEVSNKLQSLSGKQKSPGPGAPSFQQVASYRVALDPAPGAPIDDRIVEDFDTAAKQDASVVAGGMQLASWDAQDSNTLRASFGFGGDGSLGRFLPPDEDITINLDTNFQQLPLHSGATPDAAPGTAVSGGVFSFTDFYLPPQATLRIRGLNPAVITCTGTVLIEGKIDLNGTDGTQDDTFDSAVTTAPGGSGGPGGGRGGDGHPVKVGAGISSFAFIQAPQFGQAGFGPSNAPGGGGGGGQSGCTLPWQGFNGVATCINFNGAGDGSRGSGGGGGSFNQFLASPAPANTIGGDPTTFISGRRGGVGSATTCRSSTTQVSRSRYHQRPTRRTPATRRTRWRGRTRTPRSKRPTTPASSTTSGARATPFRCRSTASGLRPAGSRSPERVASRRSTTPTPTTTSSARAANSARSSADRAEVAAEVAPRGRRTLVSNPS